MAFTAAQMGAMLNFGTGDLLPLPSAGFDMADQYQLLDLFYIEGAPPPEGAAFAVRGFAGVKYVLAGAIDEGVGAIRPSVILT